MGNTSAGNDGLARNYEPRILRTVGGLEPRPSIADEERLTEEARAREADARRLALCDALSHVRGAEREVRVAREKLPRGDRQTRRDLDRIRQALARIRDRHGG